MEAWSYCAGDMLPEGCECQDSWMDDGCDAGGDAEQVGCPAQPCDASNANEDTSWCVLKPSEDCPIFTADDHDSGGHYMDCSPVVCWLCIPLTCRHCISVTISRRVL